ncbi:MAG: radical SAM protein [Planctomycetes bacterium]|nr:radical SAM protein [Planctomycetota bacterium]
MNRFKDELGFCKSGTDMVISSAVLHFGEEPPISGTRGSGTIFFTGCNMRCLFCQNYQISQRSRDEVPILSSGEYEGAVVSAEVLAQRMLSLQGQGGHNINLVSPTHFVPQILEALFIAAGKGLNIPIVYNTNGYDTVETLKLLDEIVDIYLPDIKYSDDKSAQECSGVADYVRHNRTALKEMHRQVGNLQTNENDVAERGKTAVSPALMRGLIIRHLVLPQRLAGSFASMDFIAKEISKDTFISIMSQYHPCYKADCHIALKRRLNKSEYDEVVNYAEQLWLTNCYIQSIASSNNYLPDFLKENPF